MYRNLFFAQGEDALELLDLLVQQGTIPLIERMVNDGYFNWDGELSADNQANNSRMHREHERYIVAYDLTLPYLGVQYFHFKEELS